jgi:hypothetical protein
MHYQESTFFFSITTHSHSFLQELLGTQIHFFLSSCSSSGLEVCQLRNTVEVRLLVCFCSFTCDSLRTTGRKTLYIKYTFCKGGSFLWWEVAWSSKGTQQIFKEIQGLRRCQVLNCRLNIQPQCLARSAFLFFTFLTTKSCPHVWYYIKINLQNYQFYNSLHQPQWHDSMTLEGGSSLVLQKSEPTRN